MTTPQDNTLPPDLSELENRLAHRPRPKGSPELRASVLTAVRNELHRPRRARWAAIAAIAASVLLAVGIWLAMRSPGRRTDGGTETDTPSHVIADKPTHGDPTVLAYRNAVLESPEALDELLDLHGRTLLPEVSEGIDLPAWMLAARSRKQ